MDLLWGRPTERSESTVSLGAREPTVAQEKGRQNCEVKHQMVFMCFSLEILSSSNVHWG